MTDDSTLGFETLAIHAGQEPDPVTGAVVVPIYQTTTFAQEAPGVHKGYDYSRSGNPTRTALETALAALEGGKHGYVFASGLASLTTLVMALLSANDHVIIGDDVYGGTYRLFDKVLSRFGITASYVDMTVPGAVEHAITPATKMVFLETPTNPLLKLTDIQAVAALARSRGLISVVDNTFASPYLQQPLALGADIVLHSTTKYINGHADVVGGALILADDRYADKIAFHQNAIGATADPLASWLTLRGLKTLALRMEAHSRSALEIAQFLEAHPRVEKVIYPGLPSHPQYDLATAQMKKAGGMMSFYLNGGAQETNAFLKKLRLFKLAESLGGVESLVEVPSVMTHASLSAQTRQELGITDNLVRLSVGIEQAGDLLNDLSRAIED